MREVDGIKLEIKDWESLYGGQKADGIITIKRGFFYAESPKPVEFRASGVLFYDCYFKNCIPAFDVDIIGQGCEYCHFN